MAIKYYEVTEIEITKRTAIILFDTEKETRLISQKFYEGYLQDSEFRNQLNKDAIYDTEYSVKEISAPYDYNDQDYYPMTKDDNADWLNDDSGSYRENQKNR
jgi:hypothetical protein